MWLGRHPSMIKSSNRSCKNRLVNDRRYFLLMDAWVIVTLSVGFTLLSIQKKILHHMKQKNIYFIFQSLICIDLCRRTLMWFPLKKVSAIQLSLKYSSAFDRVVLMASALHFYSIYIYRYINIQPEISSKSQTSQQKKLKRPIKQVL